MKLGSIFKKLLNKNKNCSQRVYLLIGEYVYYAWWEKQIIAALLYKYKEITCICLDWSFGWMGLAKGLSAAVDECGIL